MKTNFVKKLITELIQKGKIQEAITIPYLIQSYKIRERDETPISKEYIEYVFRHIIEDNDTPFWIRTCSTIDQLTIKITTKEEQEEFITNREYKRICNSYNEPIIYFEVYFDCANTTFEEISDLLWEKYKNQCFIPQKYSYDNYTWTEINPNEVSIIKSIL